MKLRVTGDLDRLFIRQPVYPLLLCGQVGSRDLQASSLDLG